MKRLTLSIFIFSLICTFAFSSCGSKNIKNSNIRLRINKLEAQDVDKKITGDVAAQLYENLKKQIGDRVVSDQGDSISKSANRLLAGRVSMLGTKYMLTIKVVEGEKGNILFNKTVSVKADGLKDAVDDIADQIVDCDAIWQ